MTTPATIEIQIGNLIFSVPTDNIVMNNEDINHLNKTKEETFDNMVYFRDSVGYISNEDFRIYQLCMDWYFYILEYGEDNKYDDYIIFIDLNEFYMNELKKKIQEVKEITISTDPNEFYDIDEVFVNMEISLNHLKDQDRIRFDIGDMMKLIYEFIELYFNPF